MNIKRISLTLALTLSLTGITVFAETDLTNAQRVADTRNQFFDDIESSRNAVEFEHFNANVVKTEFIEDATATRNRSVSDANAHAKALGLSRQIKKKWEQATELANYHASIYAPVAIVRERAQKKWYENHTCPICFSTYTEDVANNMTIQYRWLAKIVDERLSILKEQALESVAIYVQLARIRQQLEWAKSFRTKAIDSYNYIPAIKKANKKWRAAASKWDNDRQWVVNVAREAVVKLQKDFDELQKLDLSTQADIVAKKHAQAKRNADELLNKMIDYAESTFRTSVKNADDVLAERIADARVIVEDTPDAPWVSDQTTFNYRKSCKSSETQGVAIVFQGSNQKDPLTMNDDGEYVYKYDVTRELQRMTDLCFTIVKPKSGVNTVVEADGSIKVYRHWWMSEGRINNQSEFVTDDALEIDATIAAIKLASNFISKPIYIVYRDIMDYNSAYSASVANLTRELESRGESGLIAGYILVDSDAGGFSVHSKNNNHLRLTQLTYNLSEIKDK